MFYCRVPLTEIIQIVAHQYGETLTDEEANSVDWGYKMEYLKRNPVTVARQIDYLLQQVIMGQSYLSGMHPIGQILNFDDRREFQNRGTKHMHAQIHVVDDPKIDESNDSKVIEFIDKCITCALPDEEKYPEINKLVRKVQTHHHTTTCRQKKRVTCRFNAPWTPSIEHRIVCCEENKDEMKVKSSKKLIEKVLSYIVKIDDLSYVTQSEILGKYRVTDEQYKSTLSCLKKSFCSI